MSYPKFFAIYSTILQYIAIVDIDKNNEYIAIVDIVFYFYNIRQYIGLDPCYLLLVLLLLYNILYNNNNNNNK